MLRFSGLMRQTISPIESGENPARHRWVVERAHVWPASSGKQRIRFEPSLDTHVALLSLAYAIICSSFLTQFC
jgi:hypothetical protein